MKVLITISCLLQGGTELQTLMLSKVLLSSAKRNEIPTLESGRSAVSPAGASAKAGHAVEIICYFEHEAPIVAEFQKAGATIRLLNMDRKSGFLRFVLRLRKEIRIVKPDIVHVQYMAPGALPIVAARLAGVRTIFATVHQPYTKSHGRLAKLFLKTASLLTTRFIAVSQNAEKSWFGTCSLFDESKPLKLQPRHFTIHNAIDIGRINKSVSEVSVTDLKSQLAIPAGIPVIGAVSRLRQEKGIDILLEAFTLLIRSGEKAHLLLVGSGPDEKKLKDIVQADELNSSVTFYGEAEWERAMQLMSLLDIVVIPSRFEGFGLTAAEAMAAGKPVVASDTSGLKEVVINDETGILFPVDEAQALKIALERLIREPNLRERLGNAGRERVISNFSLELFSKKIKALYSY